MAFMSNPLSYPASPLALAPTATTFYPSAPLATTVTPAATAFPTATAPLTYGPMGYGTTTGTYGAAPGFMARHHQKKAMKEHDKAMKELSQGDSEDYYKHQSRAARHEYKYNKKAYRAAPATVAAPIGPALPYPGTSTYAGAGAGYTATLYPPFSDLSYSSGFAYADYPAFAAPSSPYGGYYGGATWF